MERGHWSRNMKMERWTLEQNDEDAIVVEW